jgi:DNA polymerase V
MVSSEQETIDLFDNVNISHDKLLPALENIRRKFGKGSLQVASALLTNDWQMSRNLMSQHYTTDLDEILEIS